MSLFDFSDGVQRALYEATDFGSRLSAKTRVHREKFSGAVKKAGFQLLSKGGSFSPGEHDIVIGAAPWSDPDLAALEDLAVYARSGAVRNSLFDIDDLSFPEMVSLLPGIRLFTRTPVILQYRRGDLTYFGQGHDAVLWLRQV